MESTTASKKGAKWTNDEIEQLKSEFRHNKTLPDIATLHGRSELAVKLQMFRVAMNLITPERSIEDVCEKYNISTRDVSDYIKKETAKKDKLDTKKAETKATNDMLKTLTEKIDKLDMKEMDSSSDDGKITIRDVYDMLMGVRDDVKFIKSEIMKFKK